MAKIYLEPSNGGDYHRLENVIENRQAAALNAARKEAKMYMDPFWVGVACTIGGECLLMVIYAIVKSWKK